VDDGEELAAPTGVVETTVVPTCYAHPTNANIRFWDLPGIGTTNYPNLPVFCEKVAIQKYDTFLIICSKRFTQYDIELAEKVKSMGKSFFFVRTKIDNDKRSEKRKLKNGFDEEKMLKALRDDCVENLQNFNFGEEKIFLVSNHKPTKWDFDRLKKEILDQLPSMQKESLTFSMRTHSKDMVNEKIQMLKSMCDNFSNSCLIECI
jgi:GTPase Era involved in 16S rRNA processing